MTSNLVLERPTGADRTAMAAAVGYPSGQLNTPGQPGTRGQASTAGHLSALDGDADLMRLADEAPEANVPVASLVAGFMVRQAGTDAAHVRLLADAAGSAQLPPILVQKRGSRIIDGMHRVEVAKLRGEWRIRARVVDCTDQQALVLAVRANTLHGLPLSRADRISGARRILSTHPDWSDRAVAAVTGLSAKAVASVRNSSTGEMQFSGKRLGRDGKRRPVQAGEGRRRAAEYITSHPEASLRQVARETDVSLGTVHDVRERLRRGTLTVAGQPNPPAAQAQAQVQAQASGSGPAPAPGSGPATPAGPPTPAGPANSAGPAHPTDPTDPGGATAAPAASRLRLARSLPARPGARGVPQPVWSAVAAKLAGDPALRYTEGGRAFLRWMTRHSAQADEWREFIDAIPEHWRHEVGRIAAGMSEEWRQFAEQLQNKQEVAS